jgi:hypothetical protein
MNIATYDPQIPSPPHYWKIINSVRFSPFNWEIPDPPLNSPSVTLTPRSLWTTACVRLGLAGTVHTDPLVYIGSSGHCSLAALFELYVSLCLVGLCALCLEVRDSIRVEGRISTFLIIIPNDSNDIDIINNIKKVKKKTHV